MDPLAMVIYLVGIVLFVGGILYFVLRKQKRGLIVALIGVVVAMLPFVLNILFAHGS